ncbi:MAG: phosphatidylserine decarboxylase family protein [Flammeovirgaceae bacterium]|nr:phosphatidylserine decarboxylase family protein [Flammeovirgaceae bacterium]
MKLHKEGNTIIPWFVVGIVALYLLLTWLIPLELFRLVLGCLSTIFLFLVVAFFRVPNIQVPVGDDLVIAPAEGKVVVLEKVMVDEFLKEERMQVSIFMSPLNVHINRAPVSGKINYYHYHPGKYLVAWHPKSSTKNERTSIGFEMSNGVNIFMRQIAGAVARRIAFYKKLEDKVSVTDEVGFIRFGSRVDLFLPLDVDLKVKIGDKTSGGETIIAHLR